MKGQNLKPLFLINAIFECIGGIIIAINPALILFNTEMDSLTLSLAKILGIAALALGIIAYQLYRHEYTAERGVRMVALAYLIYHVLIAFIMYSIYTMGHSSAMGAMSVHLVVGLISLYYYMQSIPKSNS